MKKLQVFFFVFCLFTVGKVIAQISYGGTPMFLENISLRSSNTLEYIDMPSFNLDSVKQMDELNSENMRGSFQFAYKFYTNIEKGKHGNTHVLADGTKIWRVGVRSKDAYSINLLFTRFHLPEGGKLFIYNADQNHIIGAFDYRNNTPEQILPVRPVAGDDIIIEYSEPANADFEGELTIGEVNHDYRNILATGAGEPDIDQRTGMDCMPDALCSNANEKLIRATVLLMINGQYSCTGTLVNNTANDEKPYLLTAVHCLNNNFSSGYMNESFYVTAAGTIVAFFNYNRPVCETDMKATEEMSLAGTELRFIEERKDVVLLEFKEKPPVYYNVYYAGWNMDGIANQSPYTNLHHPVKAVKKYGIYNNNPALADTPFKFGNGNPIFDSQSHWKVSFWNTGSTAGGSSGSPLFDKNNRITGTLSGGGTYCDRVEDGDYFAALCKSWDLPNSKLKLYLDPNNTGKKTLDGFDPHAANPIVRKSNNAYNNGDTLDIIKLPSNGGFLFGNNNFNISEFAEEFNLEKPSEVFGVYLFIPDMPFANTTGVEIEIYGGNNYPENLLAKQAFLPQYTFYYNGRFSKGNKETNMVTTEAFVPFSNPVKTGKKFFIAYKVKPGGSGFTVYNAKYNSPTKVNTAWIKEGQNWVKASEYTPYPIRTSLALQPVFRLSNDNFVDSADNEDKNIYYDRDAGQLKLTFQPESGGKIFVYSASGQLMETIIFSKGERNFNLSSHNKGNIGIVKIVCKNDVYSKKVLY
ncbi:MAG: hypothetical protein LBH32_01755 [Dysgonamonadaceae bacterium]|jgi:hypothetical protein|nr:hypothetical protein [Dysgonamonadaceae bacterium]